MSYDITDNICQDLQNWRYCFYQRCQNLFVITLTDNFQNQSVLAHESYQQSYFFFVDQGQLSDPDFISCTHQKENVQFAKNYCYHYTCTCRGEEGSISSPTLSHFSASEVGANKLSCLTTSFNSMVIEDREQ